MILEFSLCAAFLILITVTDVRSYRIKNSVVLVFAIAGLIIRAIRGDFLSGLLGMLLPLVLFPLFALRMLGAGDIKALCALGAMLGLRLCAWMLVFTFVSGGVIALLFMLFQKNAKERITYFIQYLRSCFLERRLRNYDFGGSGKSYFRFAYAIACGVLCTAMQFYFAIL